MVEMWSWCRTSERLVRLRAQTEYIAKRLDKDVLVIVDHHDIRIPNDCLHRFWPVLIHVVRNAVDHGFEPRIERTQTGKSAQATVMLATYESNEELIIEISDAGRALTQVAPLQLPRSVALRSRKRRPSLTSSPQKESAQTKLPRTYQAAALGFLRYVTRANLMGEH